MKTAGGRIDLVLNGPQGVWGYDPKTGKEVLALHAQRQGRPAPVRRADAGR